MLTFLALTAIIIEMNGSILGSRIDTEPDIEDPFTPSLYCDYYNARPKLSEEGPCRSKDDLDGSGVCNTTQICKEDSHCYISWRNNSGIVEVVKSGCWLKIAAECGDNHECRADNDTVSRSSGVFYCCCTGDFCNRNFLFDPSIVTLEPEEEKEPTAAVEGSYLILVKILVPLFLFCVLVILVYYCYRKKAVRYVDMERVSVDTPATDATRCSTMPFSTSDEVLVPQFLDVKARGRFGKVWRALLNEKIVAVKTFNLTEKASWQNEQDIFCTPLMNSHANILKFLAASNGREGMNPEPWLATEFYERGSLADYLKVHTVTLTEALRIMRTMASGMSFLHEDIITQARDDKPAIAHRDFKSKNVLLDQDLNAVVADFGLALKFMPGESPGESHGQVGTLRYMAPEVLEGAIQFQKDSFLRIDMYAFGLVVWEILSRCTACGECEDFRMPFEEELGASPSIDRLQEYVVEKNLRPNIKENWKRDKVVSVLCVTVDECWDRDAESRLSAGCVELRIAGIQKEVEVADSTAPVIVNNQIPSARLQGNLADTEAMNQRNLQMSVLNSQCTKNSAQPVNSSQTTTRTDEGDQDLKITKSQTEHDDERDSGAFASEDAASHDGVTGQLMAHESPDTCPEICVKNGDSDSATSLLDPAQTSDI